MSKSAQYHHNNIIDQFGLTTADIMLIPNTIANQFFSVKDSQDNIYIFCGYYSSGEYPISCFGRIIKIDKLGNKTYTNLPYGTNTSMIVNTKGKQIALTRDEQNVIISNSYSDNDNIIPVTAFDADINTGVDRVSFGNIITDKYWDLYQDRYIWTASGSTVSVYDYTTKALIDSETITSSSNYTLCVDVNNVSYLIYDVYGATYLQKNILNGSTITKTVYSVIVEMSKAKQMLIDKWGDLIILTNSGTKSRLLKYTTAGVIIENKDIGGAKFSLGTDSDGNYYYSDALNTFKIPAGSVAGADFNEPVQIRTAGMITYGNDITGYNVSGDSSVGC
jgi:hypothetical protein